MNDQIEIRLLGRLWIRLSDGSVVPSSQWTTGKTSDLMRLLALRSEQIVSTASIIAKLWPDVPEPKAMSSLATATAQLRRILGRESITRHLSGLQLQGCWVDVTAHHTLGIEAGANLRARNFAQVVAATQQAEALYVDDFHAHDDDSDWANDVRDELRARRKLMLADATDSAIELGWMRDAIAMATLAISLDSCFERAHRALMRAYSGIGETDSAIRSYERCRRNLMTELNAAPSALTESLHLQLKTAVPAPPTYSTFVGREDAVVELGEAIRDSGRGDGTELICVVGAPGSGRETLLAAAVDRVPGAHLRPVRPPRPRHVPAAPMPAKPGAIDVAVMGPLDLPAVRAHAAVAEQLATIPTQPGRVLVIIMTPETWQLVLDDNTSDYVPHFVESPILGDADLTELAHTILAGPPSSELVETLTTQSERKAGTAAQILSGWVSTGQIISTIRGLGLVSDSLSSTVLPAASTTFRVLAEQLEPTELEMCQLLAVLDRPASAADIMEFLGSERRTESRRLEIEARMDHLTARGIFVMDDDTYTFRDRTTQDLFELWLRPSLQTRIMQRIDDRRIDSEDVDSRQVT